jgi:7,8-dihydro-6-hydroxymethylpterin dimethyltransferase
MPRLPEKDYTYFQTVRGMCHSCRQIVPARVFFRDEKVWQQSLCPSCENKPALIAGNMNWYLSSVLQPLPDDAPLPGAKPPRRGCPLDCGPCTWHASRCLSPTIYVTKANDDPYPNQDSPRLGVIDYATREEIEETIDRIIESSGAIEVINLAGKEPLLHPKITAILRACRRPQIGCIHIQSDGLLLARDYRLCEHLAKLNVHLILSFDTFDSTIAGPLPGEDIRELRLRAIDNLGRAGVKISLVHEISEPVDENALGNLLYLMRHNDHILNLVIQAATGNMPNDKGHMVQLIPVDLAVQRLCEQSHGMLELGDFAAHPHAHPLCYQVCPMIKSGDELIPLRRFAPSERIADVRTIYVHSLMKEDNFDCSRAMLCPDMVVAAAGRLTPACVPMLALSPGEAVRFKEGR